ncbi:MAG: hypothetical protein QXT19_01900 [Candidatus Woesearchaeota archaeon]
MKRIFMLLVLLVLASCVPAEPTAPSEPVAVPVSEPAEPAVAPAEEPVPEPAAKPADDLAERLAKEQEQKIIEALSQPQHLPLRNRTTIVGDMWAVYQTLDSYHYKSPRGLVLIRGDKLRYLPVRQIHLVDVVYDGKKYNDVFIDEIIFDRAKRTATGYCSGYISDIAKQCITLGLSEVPFALPYDQHRPKTPDDWAQEYMNKPVVNEEYGKYFINGVETVRVKFEDGTEMYFQPSVGLPVKIVKGPLEVTEFDGIIPNRVRPEDVVHRLRSSIPPMDAFYRQIY